MVSFSRRKFSLRSFDFVFFGEIGWVGEHRIHSDRQTDRETDRQTERERQTDRETDKQKHGNY